MNKIKKLKKASVAAFDAWQALTKAATPDAEKVKIAKADYDAKQKAYEDAVEALPDEAEKDPAKVTSDEVSEMIRKSVMDGLKESLPEHLAKQLTEDGVKKIVDDALKAHNDATKGEQKKLDNEAINKVVNESLKSVMDGLRSSSKGVQLFERDDAQRGGGQVEILTSWSKGNLPLHGKQLLNILLKQPMNEGIDKKDLEKGVILGERMLQRYQSLAQAKALTSTGVGTGDEFVPTDLSTELQRRLYLASNLMTLLAAREIDMPTQPYEFPLSTTRPKFYLEATENTAATASDPGTGKVTLDARKFMAKVLFSYEVSEDSIIPVLPWIEQELALAAMETQESAIINGDVTAVHQDSDTELIAKAAERGYAGLRKLALAVAGLKVDLSAGGLNAANLRSMLKKMKAYGSRKTDLVWITGTAGESELLGLAEILTFDKAGPQATITTGRLPTLYGIPVVTSSSNREDLNASGVYDGVTTTKGSILLWNYTRWLFGRRREFTVETDRDIDVQQTKVVASYRKAFKAVETPSATISSVVVGYNYTA